MSPSTEDSDSTDQEPYLTHLNHRLHSLLPSHSHDRSGDIAPGSLDSPRMLPNAPLEESSVESLFDRICAFLHGENREKSGFGYEGKELEMRRPTGSRRW
ncbi:hypothetical protein P153DRAFT_369379 [Dothidotthia symphoricarpi CBS 119687]|uniref:Uncharacterized protein n=1 Tax=Dothidotthia symphoricarpi CBS 119687 TaxID=1392245 RepID=A0A6A6A2C7_9PLEO|nr:uncharacterized protein P153DRAFT_369379 [Dothidotthia symphoricarpi CBS 119687]KAF2125999.1 hypothetical protein P153DRAFT_369379 [Dothidotthia symphoricarpi CBS 119687]